VPRRDEPHPFLKAVGQRVKAFRLAAGLTQEELAQGGDDDANDPLGTKGHVSNLEHGLANAALLTVLKYAEAIEDMLGVEFVDFVTFPEKSRRHRVIDRTRSLTETQLQEILDKYGPALPLSPRVRKRARHRASGARHKPT
jgi:transcriptional regulator with XRE-family HTH domain